MPTKKVSLSIFLLVVFCINFIFYPIRDAVSEEEKSIPKAIPIPEPENENLSDAPRALPVQPPQKDDDLEVPKAIPLNKKEIDDKPNEIKKSDNPSDTDIEEVPKEFELPPLPPIQENILNALEKENQDVRAAWETQTEARTLTLKVPAPR